MRDKNAVVYKRNLLIELISQYRRFLPFAAEEINTDFESVEKSR